VLESRTVGFGGSGRNAGHCTPTFQHYSLAALARRIGAPWAERTMRLQTGAGALVFDLIRAHGIECEAEKNGFLQVAHLPSRMATIRARHSDYAALGCRTRLVDRDEAIALTGSPRFYGGWIFEEAGHLNPLGFARGHARAALANGAAIFTHSPVRRIDRAGTLWRLETEHGSALAERVVVATGAYTGSIWPGLARSFARASVACMASVPLAPEHRTRVLPGNNHVLDTRGDFTNVRLDREGRLITSVFVEGNRGRDRALTMTCMSDRFQWLYPDLPRIDWQYFWSGDVDLHPDTFPQFAALAPGVTAAIGYSSRGVPTATAMGRQLALHALGMPESELAVKLAPLRPVPRGFALIPRLLLPYYRLRDALDARLQRVAVQ
jgi:glycine/D-amino acid oxidase-like deaminating enzyme